VTLNKVVSQTATKVKYLGRPDVASRKIREALLGGPSSWKELVERTKLPGPTVHHALRRLKKNGLVSTMLSEDDEILWTLTSVGVVSSLVGYAEAVQFSAEVERTDKKLSRKPLVEWTDEQWKTGFEDFLHHVNAEGFAKWMGITPSELQDQLLATQQTMKPAIKRIWDFVFGQFNASVAHMLVVYVCARTLMQKLPADQRERVLENIFDRDLLPALKEAFNHQLTQYAFSLFLGRPKELPT
jgi:DNA-binding transcriptional ArsR family regulator